VLMANPLTDIGDWFADLWHYTVGVPTTAVENWLSSLGGEIGSGIESGFVALTKDLWDVVVGPLEIFIGAILILFALIFALKDDLWQAGAMFGLMMA
jgi:hypothetical protein